MSQMVYIYCKQFLKKKLIFLKKLHYHENSFVLTTTERLERSVSSFCFEKGTKKQKTPLKQRERTKTLKSILFCMSNLPSCFPTLRHNGSSDSEQSFLFLSSPFNDKKRIIILDWDDTLLPTSYLLCNPGLLQIPYHLLPNDFRTKLQELEAIVLELMLKLIKLDNCHCYIVSNAMSNWILFSCQTYFPTLFRQIFYDLQRGSSGHNNNGQKPSGLFYGENSSLMTMSKPTGFMEIVYIYVYRRFQTFDFRERKSKVVVVR
ncbi:hypothetical protein RFI_27097 [Reticulomyxa filosa]|uniref:Uncharacterized protein n=1 Tax=Reticulomyxa filosa TaxID=46433 RepID=X6M8P0_RETFI|nr:hypothetical protein RFI_27097 [Reticulomyxa filosa]|eukprot:ETO10279.1 hypothetical protein RFI_27097 [Reticulomyxa filosa]